MQPLPLPDGSYADEARPWTAQDVINWIPTQAESTGTRTPTKYMTPPGLRPFVQAGTGPVRGTYNAEGRLLAVIGKMLYRISNTGVAIPIGTVPGVSRVAFAHNQITSGNEVLVVNGSAGYVYNTVDDSFERITDEGYPGGISATFIDGYLLQIEPARRYAFHSDIADAMSYNTLDRFTSEYRPDLLVALASSNNELILFSETSYEVFENTGANQQPFRSRQITGDKGCASRYGVAVMDQRVLWLADDGMFYAMEGYSPKRISTRAIEQSILGLNWGQAFAEVWEEAGHSICYWTFPDGMTWGWDASTGKWHRRQSYEMKRWRVNTMTKWGQKWIAGDFQGPRLWTVDRDYMLEGDIEYISEVTTGVIHNNQNRVVMPRLEVIMDAGQEETVATDFAPQPAGPQISGNAPDGTVTFPYPGYQYTVTEGDAPIESVTIVGNALPDGLEMSNSGLIDTGPPTLHGEYTFTVRVTDTNGLYAELEDTIQISNIGFMLRDPTEGLWIAQNLTDWEYYTFSPTSVTSQGGEVAVAGGYFTVGGINETGTPAEKYMRGPLPPYVATSIGVTVQTVETGVTLLPSLFFASGGVTIGWEKNANFGYYWLSSAPGAAFTKVNLGSGKRLRGVKRMDSGRWVAVIITNSTGVVDMYYSDAAIPSAWADWTFAMTVWNTTSTDCVGAREYAYQIGTDNQVWRTADGIAWAVVNDGTHIFPSNCKIHVAENGRVLIYGDDTFISYSDDLGVNWDDMAMPVGIERIKEMDGTLYASGVTDSFFTAPIDGEVWTTYGSPWVESAGPYIVPFEIQP